MDWQTQRKVNWRMTKDPQFRSPIFSQICSPSLTYVGLARIGHCKTADTLHTAHYTLNTEHWTLNTLHTAHSTLHTVNCTLHTTHYTLHTVHCTLHTAHCGLQTSNCKLHNTHCTLNTVCPAHCNLQTANWKHTLFIAFCMLHVEHTIIYMYSTVYTEGATHCICCTLHTAHCNYGLHTASTAHCLLPKTSPVRSPVIHNLVPLLSVLGYFQLKFKQINCFSTKYKIHLNQFFLLSTILLT